MDGAISVDFQTQQSYTQNSPRLYVIRQVTPVIPTQECMNGGGAYYDNGALLIDVFLENEQS